MKLGMKKLSLVVLLTILAASFMAYAVIKFTTTIPNTANIKGYEVILWRKDTNVAVTSIGWGDLETGSSIDTETIFSFSKKLTIKSLSDFLCWAAWKIDPSTPLPNGITLVAEYEAGAAWITLPQNEFGLLGSMSPGEVNNKGLHWILTVPNDAPRGALAFNIQLLAANTVSG